MKRTRFTLLVGGLMATIFVITGCPTDRDGFLTSEQLLTGQGPDQALSSDFGSAVGQLEPFDREKLAQEEKE